MQFYLYFCFFCFFFFNDTATTEIYTLSLHDALPISHAVSREGQHPFVDLHAHSTASDGSRLPARSEEHTSELQSQFHLVCRLLLEKKKKKTTKINDTSNKDINYHMCD